MGRIATVLETWFNSPRGHAFVGLMLGVAAQIWPQYAAALNTGAAVAGYGTLVAGASSPKVGP
jgi:hypothetical protein